VIYCFGYCTLAFYFRNKLSKFDPRLTWILALVMATVGSAAPLLLGFIIHLGHYFPAHETVWWLGHPLAAILAQGRHGSDQGMEYLYFGALFASGAAILNLGEFARQFETFRRERKAIVE
jgi:hypothetical protein